MYEQYDALIFDMDGTIIDSEPTHRKAWHQVMSRYGVTPDDSLMTRFNGAPGWHLARFLIEQHQLDQDPMLLAAEKWSVAQTLLLNEVRPLPLLEVAKSYHGRKPMAVGTGSQRATAESLLQHLGVREIFSALVAADDVEQHKPEPETFLRCAELLGVSPERCVVFEDADFGIRAAKAAGMAVVDVRTL